MKKIILLVAISIAAISITGCEKTDYKHPLQQGK